MIRHQLDFRLTLIDHKTDQAVKGTHLFWLNDIPIRPTKVVGEDFIFSDLMTDYQKRHVANTSEALTLRWENSYYLSLEVDFRTQHWTHRAKPSYQYPLKEGEHLVKGQFPKQVRLFYQNKTKAMKYHLMRPILEDGLVYLASAKPCRLSGRHFLISEGDQVDIFLLLEREEGHMRADKLKHSYSEQAKIIELTSVEVSDRGEFSLVLDKPEDRFSENDKVILYTVEVLEIKSMVASVDSDKGVLILDL